MDNGNIQQSSESYYIHEETRQPLLTPTGTSINQLEEKPELKKNRFFFYHAKKITFIR